MDLTVQRVFVFLIVIFSFVFGILSVFFRSTIILGFPGDYWAGILFVGIAFLIMGWAIVSSTSKTMHLPKKIKEGRVPYLAYVSITISSLGIILCGILFLGEGEFEVLPLYCVIPPGLSLMAIILSKLSLDTSMAIKSERGKYWSNIGLLLALICFFSPWIFLFIVS